MTDVALTMDPGVLPIEPYYDNDGFTLYHGDCRDILPLFPMHTFDCIFADPPYNLSNGGFTCKSGRRAPVDKGDWDVSRGIEEDFSFHRDWIQACRDVLKENGTIWVSGTYHSIYACGYALQLEGYHFLNDICWFKPNAPPNLSGRFFTASHETLLWARKKTEERHTFHYEAMKHGDWHIVDRLKNDGKQMRSVWSIPAPRREEKHFGKHPTQKPLALLTRILCASSSPGDLVLDPFTGSSTTGLAAYRLKRRFVGIDTEKDYLDLSIRRFEAIR